MTGPSSQAKKLNKVAVPFDSFDKLRINSLRAGKKENGNPVRLYKENQVDLSENNGYFNPLSQKSFIGLNFFSKSRFFA